MKEKVFKIFRVCTVAPIICLCTLLAMLFADEIFFTSTVSFVFALIFLVLFPLSSYLVWFLIKGLKNKGRKPQRTLAIIFSFIGYVVSFVLTFIFRDSLKLKLFIFTYLASGSIILIFRLFNKFNPSGHASGIVGPITFLVLYVNYYFAFLYLIAILIGYVSIKMQRHSFLEYVIGAIIPTSILLISFFIFF